MKDNSLGILYAAITASLWGFMAIVLKIVVTDIDPVTVVWFRFASAFILLSVLTLIFKRSDFSIYRKIPWKLVLTAVFLGFNYLGFISGIKYVSPSSSQVFIMIAPIAFALSGIVIFREKVSWMHIVGFIVVIAGIILFYSEQIAAMRGSDHQFTRGMLLIFGGGLSWAVFASLQKSLVSLYTPNQLNLFIYSFCSLLLMPFANMKGMGDYSGVEMGLLIYLGFNTVFAYGSLGLAIKYTEATRVSVIITMNPIITFLSMAILGRMNVTWIEHESFSMVGLFGALMVVIGAIVVILAGRARKR